MPDMTDLLLILCNYRKPELLRFTKLFQRGEHQAQTQVAPSSILTGGNIFC